MNKTYTIAQAASIIVALSERPTSTQKTKKLTIQQYKDKIKQEYGYDDWDGNGGCFQFENGTHSFDDIITEAMILYASQSSTANKGDGMSDDQIYELGKLEVDYIRQLAVCGKKEADSVLYFWMKGFKKAYHPSPPLDREELLRWVEERIERAKQSKGMGSITEANAYTCVKEKLLSLPPQKQSDASGKIECTLEQLKEIVKLTVKGFASLKEFRDTDIINAALNTNFKSETNK